MSRKPRPITVRSAAPPDLDAAADAMLPLFLAFLEGRLVTPAPSKLDAATEEPEPKS